MGDNATDAGQTALHQLETERLVLRHWVVGDVDDARALYRYSSNPKIGPQAAWPPRTSVEQCMHIIVTTYRKAETYAIVAKDTGEPIGCIALTEITDDWLLAHVPTRHRDGRGDSGTQIRGMAGDGTRGAYEAVPSEPEAAGSIAGDASDDASCMELGYWIGEPFWGRGLIPEAARAMLRHGFEDLGLRSIWGTANSTNRNSRIVLGKIGMRQIAVEPHVRITTLPGDVFWDEAIYRITRDEWLAR